MCAYFISYGASYLAHSSKKEITKYTSEYYLKLIKDTFLPNGSLATGWARFRVHQVLRLLGKTKHLEVILDLGSGIGTFTALLSRSALVVGVDFSREAVRVAKFVVNKYGNESNAGLIRCDVQYLPFKNDAFDNIVVADLVGHLYEKQYVKCMSECKRVLRGYGFLIIYTPNPINSLSPYFYLRRGGPFDPTHVGLKSALFLYKNLINHGFEIRKLYCSQYFSTAISDLIARIANKILVFPFLLVGRTCIKVEK